MQFLLKFAKFTPRPIISLFLSLVMIITSLSYAKPVAAVTYQLSGRVTDQSNNPISGTTVDVLTAGTLNIVVSDTADTNGDYSVLVDEGIYDVQVTPPVGSGFQKATVFSTMITDNTVLDFVLVPAETFTLSGQLLDALGNGLANQTILLSGGGLSYGSSTDASGNYSIELPSGEYQVEVQRLGNPLSINAPYQYSLVSSSNLTITQDTTMDIQLPFKRVSIHVQDPAGNPVSNAIIRTNEITNSNLTLASLPASGISKYPSSTAVTSASGDVDLWLFPTLPGNLYTLTVIPPTGSPYVQFNVEDVVVTEDKSIIIVLQFVHDPPVTVASLSPSPNPQGEYPDPTTVTLSATAFTGFTIEATYYEIDSGTTQTYSVPFEVSGDGIHTITFWSVDNVGVFEAPNTESFTIHANLPPSVDADGPYYVDEGDFVQVTATGFDPENGPLMYAWDLDNNGSFETPGQSVNFSAALLDGPSSPTIAVQATDDGGLTASGQSTVNVLNVAPTVDAIIAPLEPVLISTLVNTSTSFVDHGIPDTHTAIWDWGDTFTSTGSVDQINDTVSGSHTYTTPGVYEIKVTVTDDDLYSGESIYQFVVVYDSSASGDFVTGAGKIDSPAGAYTANPSLAGLARFGFVSKYQLGASIPTGVTQFRFQTAQFSFTSHVYQWLVVAGPQAKFKGTGTLSGAGNYGFLLSATDGEVNGGGGVDKFRIKIWDKDNNDEVVYDNQLGAGDNSDPTTIITGGNIVIH